MLFSEEEEELFFSLLLLSKVAIMLCSAHVWNISAMVVQI